MYEYISGPVSAMGVDYAVIEASGVGYYMLCSAKTLNRIGAGELVRLYVHLHLAEGIMLLYGFFDEAERMMFRKLISISRVGPKLAMSILSHLTPSDLTAAVITDNAAAFAGIPGMGKKTASRLLLELQGTMGPDQIASVGLSTSVIEHVDIRAEAVSALVALGYDGATASRAVSKVEQANELETLISAALRGLAKG